MATFDQIKFPVHKATKPLDEEFPELFRSSRQFETLKDEKKDWERLIKYIIFLYDKGTDLSYEYPELKDRKEAAATEAGFTKTKAGWPKELREAMSLEDKAIFRAIMYYLRIQNNPLWTEIQVTEQELLEFQTLRFEPTTRTTDKKNDDQALERAKKKAPLMDLCNARLKTLELLNKQFYGDHKDVQEYSEMVTPEKAERIIGKQVTLEEASV